MIKRTQERLAKKFDRRQMIKIQQELDQRALTVVQRSEEHQKILDYFGITTNNFEDINTGYQFILFDGKTQSFTLYQDIYIMFMRRANKQIDKNIKYFDIRMLNNRYDQYLKHLTKEQIQEIFSNYTENDMYIELRFDNDQLKIIKYPMLQ